MQPIDPIQAPAFHKGGKVPNTGAYILKRGEHVIAKGKRKMTNKRPELISIGALKA
jgi:hypothetical protein